MVPVVTMSMCVQAQIERPQMPCHLTRTTEATHQLIRDNLAETPVYGGWIDSKGPRYCPSIEDKIVRFADKPSHQVGHCALKVVACGKCGLGSASAARYVM